MAKTKPTEDLSNTTLKVKAASPFNIYFDGEAKSVTALNKTGPFDVLPGHANFISILDKCTVEIKTPQDTVKVPVEKGVMKVYANDVNIFVNV